MGVLAVVPTPLPAHTCLPTFWGPRKACLWLPCLEVIQCYTVGRSRGSITPGGVGGVAVRYKQVPIATVLRRACMTPRDTYKAGLDCGIAQ